MLGPILKATNSSFQKGMIFCRSIYVKKVMKLLAFIFEQPSYFNVLHQLSSNAQSANAYWCIKQIIVRYFRLYGR